MPPGGPGDFDHFDDDHINGVEHLLARMGAETLTIPKAEGGAALDLLLNGGAQAMTWRL